MQYSEKLSQLGERQQKLMRLLLKNPDGLSIEELTEQLDVTRTAVKQHLHALEEQGAVAQGQLRVARGRPSRVYVLTLAGTDFFPKQYSWFSSELLKSLKAASGAEQLISLLKTLAGGIAESISQRVKGKTGTERIKEVQKILTELGYEAVVERNPARHRLPVIEAYNCVYHDLAAEHPEVCEFDLQLLATLSGTEVTHEECMVRGGKCCRFSFEGAKEKAATK
jgi:predicted ArsR family transcriptional regulator